MMCPKCSQRKGKRECPALHTTICAVCCGTKRLTEIQCPDDCVHLTSARQHPPAVVLRQQEKDAALVVPGIRHLNGRQLDLYYVFLSAIVRHEPDGFGRLVDDDVANAAEAVAKTLETAANGVIYEHPASSPQAGKLARELKELLDGIRSRGTRVYDAEAAVALRAVETGARDAHAGGAASTTYLDAIRRLLQARPGDTRSAEPPRDEPRLIIP
jgi:hypothetical protein